MNAGAFGSSLTSTGILLRDLRLLHHPQLYASLVPSEAFMRLALASDSSYGELYREGLKNRDYNFLLVDFSYFQFQYRKVQKRFEVRYAFYANPFAVVTFEEFCFQYDCDPSEGDTYELFLQALEEMDERSLVPLLRYEVSFEQYAELIHPTAHLHIGMHATNRWPVERVLTPLAFTLLIAKHFYSDAWAQQGASSNDDEEEINRFDEMFIKAKADSDLVEADFFSARERQQIYLG
jgi:hypothetical protein